jgi:hypothetical protein
LEVPDAHRAFERLAGRGTLPGSEAARLAVLSCAAYAERHATRSAAGLFWHLVHRKLWDRPSLADEDRARRWLRSEGDSPDERRRSELEHAAGAAGRLLASGAFAEVTIRGVAA